MRLPFPQHSSKASDPIFQIPFPFPKPLFHPQLYLLLLFYLQDGVEGNQALTLISERKYPECSACEPRPFTVLPRGCCQHRKYPGGRGEAGSSYSVMRGVQGPRAYCREAQLSIRPPWNF